MAVDMWTAMWLVVGWTVVGGGGLLAVILIVSARQVRRANQRAEALRAELTRWGDHNGWSVADAPPPELLAPGLDEVIPGERHRFTIASSRPGRPAAITWCDWSDNDTDRKYATLLVRLPASYPTLRLRHRPGLVRRSTEFHRQVKVDADIDEVLTEPVRAALLRLRSVSGWSEEFVRLEGNVMRVVVNDWPGPHAVEALLEATTEVIGALRDPTELS